MSRLSQNGWTKKLETLYWAAQGLLGRPGSFVRTIAGGGRFEAIVPGDWTQFDCLAIPKEVFEKLLEDGYLEESTDHPGRWRSKAVRKARDVS